MSKKTAYGLIDDLVAASRKLEHAMTWGRGDTKQARSDLTGLRDALRAELAAKDAEIERLRDAWQEEHTERIRLEERLKLANATVKFMAEDSGYDSEEEKP